MPQDEDIGGEASTESTHRVGHDRHGRRDRSTTTPTTRTGPRRKTGPRWTLGPSKTVPMSAQEYEQAVQAWAVLISSWWTQHPPEDHDS